MKFNVKILKTETSCTKLCIDAANDKEAGKLAMERAKTGEIPQPEESKVSWSLASVEEYHQKNALPYVAAYVSALLTESTKWRIKNQHVLSILRMLASDQSIWSDPSEKNVQDSCEAICTLIKDLAFNCFGHYSGVTATTDNGEYQLAAVGRDGLKEPVATFTSMEVLTSVLGIVGELVASEKNN
jgi:hypothetical protein